MLFKTIAKSEIPALVRGFAQRYEVVGPVERDGTFVFDTIGDDPDRLRIVYPTTILPPKKYLLPQCQTLLEFDTAENKVLDVPASTTPRVLFGVHACDINAINQLDRVFCESDFGDPYYEPQRAQTLIVGVSCMPEDDCFCNVWGTGEVSSGYDLFLHDIGDRYLVSIISTEAAEILASSTEARAATDEDSAAFMEQSRIFHDAFKTCPSKNELPMKMDAFYNESLWDDIGNRCVSCGACTTVCPTCHCFDMVDQLSADGHGGKRVRTWDSCCNPAFSVVTGGYNFRGTGALRVKNFYYHKFVGYPRKYDRIMCTGCGRCVSACPAHIDPRLILEALNSVGGRDIESAGSAEGASR